MPVLADPVKQSENALPRATVKHGIKHILFESILAIAAVIVALEFLFALAGVGEQEYLRVDKVLGFCPMENRHVTWRKEGFGRIQFNSQGMNDVEYPLVKPAGTYRIAIVGDSFVESLQVDRQKNFLSLMQRDLNAKYGTDKKHIEVMNFGCSANSMGQFYKKIQTKVLRYQPDVVLIGLSVDATKLLAPLQGGFAFANARPTFILDKQGKLVEDWQIFNWWNHSADGKRFANTAFLRQYSHIWGAIGTMMGSYSAWCADLQAGKVWGWGAVNLSPPKAAVAPAVAVASASASAVKPTVKAANYTGPVSGPFMEQSINKPGDKSTSQMAIPQAQGDVDAATKQYWPVADQLIRAMNSDCQAHHCRFGIIHLPARPDIGYDNPRETRYLEEISHELKIPYVDLTDDFLNAPKQTALIYSVHMTEAGHVLTNKVVEKFVESNFLD